MHGWKFHIRFRGLMFDRACRWNRLIQHTKEVCRFRPHGTWCPPQSTRWDCPLCVLQCRRTAKTNVESAGRPRVYIAMSLESATCSSVVPPLLKYSPWTYWTLCLLSYVQSPLKKWVGSGIKGDFWRRSHLMPGFSLDRSVATAPRRCLPQQQNP